ncbi:Coat F domain protein [Pelotomaculum sp. FP]|uniref:spore coat protein n=1 Tax=Pelotomaculum sp. FP TaxID=261474 RepID=UPI0011005661|nr:spore coat protein [Pelotomaculum sp. FP]TEB15554.1 Coat F domain protein [Pelotomaculum sp. FP]
MDEKERLSDALITQKYITGGYNLAIMESADNRLRETFMGILKDEHQIHFEIFNEMKNRGWYQPARAGINQVSQHMNSWNQELRKIQRTGAKPAGIQQHTQSNIPLYTYQTGLGLPQTAGTSQQQVFYRPPQGPLT